MKNSYTTFALMILTSTIVMFALMYLNTYAIDHVFFSETRAYMAMYMGGAMAVIMLAFMLGMYSNKTFNTAIFAGATIVFAVSLYLVRSQTTVEDISWMKAMIPHHSIAILTSSRANIFDPRVRSLADDIIEAQKLVACPNKSGPSFALELASEMELNYGQESQTRRDYCEVASR